MVNQLLVVDDDALILRSLKLALTKKNWELSEASSLSSLPKGFLFDAAFVDIHLSGQMEQTEGIQVIQQLRNQNPNIEIVAISGDMSRQIMERALQAGASRFLAKPLNFDEVVLTLKKIKALIELRHSSQKNRASQPTHPSLCWVGTSPASQEIRKKIASFSGESGPLLIEGESGTGKEVVAHLIHPCNPSSMVSVNVAAIPENLFESEFFGHTKGAFTGAEHNKMGLAEAAQGGKLFLDEIEALSPAMQVKLLRFLESGEIRRVGSKHSQTIQTQVIVATNKNLEAMVVEECFREDLLWRLSGKKIILPPLRERKEDIVELAQYFLNLDRVRKKQLTLEAIEQLSSYKWPGNVRELKRVCEQLSMNSPLPLIRREDVRNCLPLTLFPNHFNAPLTQGLQAMVNEFEAQTIKKCLEQTNDIDETLKVLQISRSNLYKKIKDHHINWKKQR